MLIAVSVSKSRRMLNGDEVITLSSSDEETYLATLGKIQATKTSKKPKLKLPKRLPVKPTPPSYVKEVNSTHRSWKGTNNQLASGSTHLTSAKLTADDVNEVSTDELQGESDDDLLVLTPPLAPLSAEKGLEVKAGKLPSTTLSDEEDDEELLDIDPESAYPIPYTVGRSKGAGTVGLKHLGIQSSAATGLLQSNSTFLLQSTKPPVSPSRF
jgi:hypothetical protein